MSTRHTSSWAPTRAYGGLRRADVSVALLWVGPRKAQRRLAGMLSLAAGRQRQHLMAGASEPPDRNWRSRVNEGCLSTSLLRGYSQAGGCVVSRGERNCPVFQTLPRNTSGPAQACALTEETCGGPRRNSGRGGRRSLKKLAGQQYGLNCSNRKCRCLRTPQNLLKLACYNLLLLRCSSAFQGVRKNHTDLT